MDMIFKADEDAMVAPADQDFQSPMTEQPLAEAALFRGFVDFYGYHALSAGWFFAGWISHSGRLDEVPGPVAAIFADQVITGDVASLLFFREDVGGHGIGFLFFLPAASPTASAFRHLTVALQGCQQTVAPVFEACHLPESRLLPLLHGILAVSEAGPRRRAMELLVTGRANQAEQGFIEYSGYHAAAGGWFFSGWISQGWAAGETPLQVSVSFAGDDIRGDAVAVLYGRRELAPGASGVIFFVPSKNQEPGTLHAVNFHVGGAGMTLPCLETAPQLREAELVPRLRANLAYAPSSPARDRLFNTASRRLHNGEDTLSALGPAISLYVDEAIICGAEGLALIGWMLAKPGEIRNMQIRCGALAVTVSGDDWLRVARPDVLAAFVKHGFDDADCGFVAYLPGHFDPAERLYLQVETVHGEIVFRDLPRPVLRGIPAIRRILDSVDLRHGDVRAAYDRVLGPAVAALNQVRLGEPPGCRVIDYGELPRTPEFSVIVPLYGRLDFVEYQLALFSAHPGCAATEFIYVLDDPGRKQEAQALFAAAHQRFLIPFRAVLLDRNCGFAQASNIGLQHAHGHFVAYLNSDVFPGTLDWLERLSARLIEDPSLGAVGPMLLYEDGAVQHRGMYFARLPELGDWFFCQHHGKGMRDPGDGGIQRFISITGACMVMRRALAERFGGFSETYVIGDFEDSDLCLRLQEAGFGCAVDADVKLFHLERKSQNFSAHNWRLNLTAYNAWQHQQRWGATIAARQSDGSFP